MNSHRDLLDRDLAGWELRNVYLLEIDHGLWAYMPVILNDDTSTIVATLDEKLCDEMLRVLPKEKCKRHKLLMLVNQKTGTAFNLPTVIMQHDLGKDAGSILLLTREKFDELCAKQDEPFRWAH